MIGVVEPVNKLFSVASSEQETMPSSKEVIDLIKQLREDRSKDIQKKVINDLHDDDLWYL